MKSLPGGGERFGKNLESLPCGRILLPNPLRIPELRLFSCEIPCDSLKNVLVGSNVHFVPIDYQLENKQRQNKETQTQL